MTINPRKKVTPVAFDSTDIPLMARVTGLTNIALVQANVSTLSRNVYVKGNSPSAPSTLTPISAYIYDTLQTADAAWSEDTVGYNFKDNLPNTALTTEGVWYVDYEIVDINSKKIAWGFEISVVGR